jgi:hypothetical protein
MRFILTAALVAISYITSMGQVDTGLLSAEKDTARPQWQFETEAYYYIVPGETDEIVLLGYADYKSFHIEVRYNYEDLQTGSVFGGYRLETGNRLVFGCTPVAGIVFGNTNGIAPGILLDLSYGQFDFYSESEYLFDFAGKENNFIYSWIELGWSPNEHIRTGISGNRTRLIQTEREIQNGVFAQYSFMHLTAGFHYFNPLSEDYFLIATLSYAF